MNHLIMQCHAFREDQNSMFKEMSMCENLSKIVCQVSLLNSNNEFLKSLTRFARFCIHCD